MEAINRDLFPILKENTYFNTCSIGALAIPVKEALFNFINQWDQFGGVSWLIEGGWSDALEKARSNFATLINATPENIAFSFGNSVSVGAITSSMDFTKKNEVIFSDQDFPSSPANLMAKEHLGVKSKIVKSKDGVVIEPEDFKMKITDQTKLIALCEVISNTGFRMNTEAICELAHSMNIPVLLDSYQSMGTIPIDVKKTDVDFLFSGCLKYLLGGFGISFMYVRNDWIENMKPTNIGWYGVKDPFLDLFDKLRTNLSRPSDATKFQMGTPYPPGSISANAGMKIVENIGINRIYNHNMNITQEIIDKARDKGIAVLTPIESDMRGSIVNLQIANAVEVVKRLQETNFILDMRSNGLRVAPHFYNDSEDVDRLIESINM